MSEEKLTETLSSLRGYQWENHAKGATVHITELAQTFHIGITWWSIGRYGISFVQASFFSFFQGGGTLEQPNLHWNMCKFCDFLNDKISGKFCSNPGETKFSQTTNEKFYSNFLSFQKKKNNKVLAELIVKWNTWWFTQRYYLLLWYIKLLGIAIV